MTEQEDDIDFFEDSQNTINVTDNDLKKLSRLVATMQELRKEEAIVEAKLARLKKEIERYETDVIPAAMNQIGMDSFKLTDGSKITIKDIVRAGIPKARKEEGLKYLRDNEAGDLIKQSLEMNFGKGQDENFKKTISVLDSLNLNYDTSEEVHWQTLTAWVKEKIKKGAKLPKDLLGIYTGQKAVVELPK